MDTSLEHTFQRQVHQASADDAPAPTVHISTMTWVAQWERAPPNLQTILETDTAYFKRSTFCSTAFEFHTQSAIRCRIYPSSHKVVVTGCRTEHQCIETLDRLQQAFGGCDWIDRRCHLININIDLPWTLNRYTAASLETRDGVRLVEVTEGRPATIVHIDTGSRIKKALVYQSSGKVSLHTSSWKESIALWNVLWPALHQCRGITKTPKS